MFNLQDLLAALIDLLDATGQLLLSTGEITAPLQRAGRAIGVLCALLESQFLTTTTVSPVTRPQDEVFLVRGLERSTALIACVNEEIASHTNLPLMRHHVEDAEWVLAKSVAGLNVQLKAIARTVARSEAHSDYLVQSSQKVARRFLLAAIVADLLDLCSDICDDLAVSTTPFVGVRGTWDQVRIQFQMGPIEQREYWPCGEILTPDSMATSLGITEDELKILQNQKKVLAVPLWDGDVGYPSVQLTAGLLLPGMARLLRSLSTTVSPWHVALWLGKQSAQLGGETPAWRMRNGMNPGWTTIRTILDERELLKKNSSSTSGALAVPDAASVAKAFGQGFLSYVAGWAGGPLNLAVARAAGKPLKKWSPGRRGASRRLPGQLYRITKAENGPFYFSSPRSGRAGGRFDLSGGQGTCYFSVDAYSAFEEVFKRRLVLDAEAVASSALWLVSPRGDVGPLLDLTDQKVTSCVGWSIRGFTSSNRSATQAFGSNVQAGGYRGLVHQLQGAGGNQGIALFGPAGRVTPEMCGLSSWSSVRVPLAMSPEFWAWVASAPLASGRAFPFFNQIPADLRKLRR